MSEHEEETVPRSLTNPRLMGEVVHLVHSEHEEEEEVDHLPHEDTPALLEHQSLEEDTHSHEDLVSHDDLHSVEEEHDDSEEEHLGSSRENLVTSGEVVAESGAPSGSERSEGSSSSEVEQLLVEQILTEEVELFPSSSEGTAGGDGDAPPPSSSQEHEESSSGKTDDFHASSVPGDEAWEHSALIHSAIGGDAVNRALLETMDSVTEDEEEEEGAFYAGQGEEEEGAAVVVQRGGRAGPRSRGAVRSHEYEFFLHRPGTFVRLWQELLPLVPPPQQQL